MIRELSSLSFLHPVLQELENKEKDGNRDLSAPAAGFNFRGIISSYFEPYLTSYVELEQKTLMENLEKLVQVARKSGISKRVVRIMFYLVACRYLKKSSKRMLKARLPKGYGWADKGITMNFVTSDRDEKVICYIVNSAEYCRNTVCQWHKYDLNKQHSCAWEPPLTRSLSILLGQDASRYPSCEDNSSRFPVLGRQMSSAASYSKFVSREMSKAEALLKVILSPVDSVADTYRALLPEGMPMEFQRILELKGLKKADQQTILDDFNKQSPPVSQPSILPSPASVSAVTTTPAPVTTPAAAVAAATSLASHPSIGLTATSREDVLARAAALGRGAATTGFKRFLALTEAAKDRKDGPFRKLFNA
ncbi:Vacuolar protein sorting-associated protein 53 A [Linum grandiflorum]